MGRKTGKDAKLQVEVGTTYYAMAALSTVSSPSSDVGKKFMTSATYLSDQEDLQPVVRLDGVVSGLNISSGTANNSIDVTAGTVYIQGSEVTVEAATLTGLERPTSQANVKVYAVVVDVDGTISTVETDEGVSNTTRGSAGAVPFIPLNQVLLGYVTTVYYDGSASGATTITASEINNETKERATIPSFEILYHDGAGTNATNYGAIVFATALPLIHAANAEGPASARRNVYASYYSPEFEDIPDVSDSSFDEDISTTKSRAYRDSAEESALGIPSWSGSATAYYKEVNDLLSLIKNSKRWVKFYPDADETAHWSGRAVIKVGRAIPVDDNLSAPITIEGSGRIYSKAS